jgi:beta-glucanase (GH16 family)
VEASSAGLRLKTLNAGPDCPNKIKWSTGSIQSKAEYRYGFFEATMKIADIKGMNNAFWMNTGNQPRDRGLLRDRRLRSPISKL